MLAAALIVALAGAPTGPADLREALRTLPERSDLVLLEPGAVTVATRVRAAPRVVRAVLLDPSAYTEALPSLVRADVVATRVPAAHPDRIDRRVAWELEIPLFNLEGRMWVRPIGDLDVEMVLEGGDLAPGRFVLHILPDGDGAVLVVHGAANLRGANWLFRRMVAKSPLAEPAMTAAAAYVLARATAERAEHPTDPKARRPRAPSTPPGAPALDGRPLAAPALAALRGGRIAAMVQRLPGGSLSGAHVAVPTSAGADAVLGLLAAPAGWRRFPGWRHVEMQGTRVAIDADLGLCDLDAEWETTPGPPTRARAVRGATRGAALALDAFPDGGGSVGVLSLAPRLEAAGWMPRRFIRAEPLLEHGLALALAYVDAMSLIPAAAGGTRAPSAAPPAAPPPAPAAPAPAARAR